MVSPIPLSPAILREARGHFADHCAGCHANNGSGKTPIGENVYPKALDLRQRKPRQCPMEKYFTSSIMGFDLRPCLHGEKGRPEDDRDSWKLVHFIRRLPQITEQELADMRALNPKSPHERQEEAEFDRFLQGDNVEVHSSHH